MYHNKSEKLEIKKSNNFMPVLRSPSDINVKVVTLIKTNFTKAFKCTFWKRI